MYVPNRIEDMEILQVQEITKFDYLNKSLMIIKLL